MKNFFREIALSLVAVIAAVTFGLLAMVYFNANPTGQPGIAGTIIETTGPLLLVAIIIAPYFLPTLIAAFRSHHQTVAIFATNLLLGWTVLGWIAALIWSLTAVQRQPN